MDTFMMTQQRGGQALTEARPADQKAWPWIPTRIQGFFCARTRGLENQAGCIRLEI